jgi:hypothetical protein
MTETTRIRHPIGIDGEEQLTVALYVRSDISAASRRQIDAVTERLRTLAQTPLLDDVRLEQWPPQQSIAQADGVRQSPRGELASEFEEWATRHGVSLRPAIRRQVVPSSLVGAGDAYTEVRVPVMTLALYAEDADELRGVVPYTVGSQEEESTTYTVDDWLSAVESESANVLSKQGTQSGEQNSTA